MSWYLNEEWIGEGYVFRQDDFRADENLPSAWYRVNENDYDSNGFDRGHNCPSADRRRTTEDNSITFLMTNMTPQAPDHNRELWADMEQYCRELVYQGNELFIIMGSHGIGGTGDAGYLETIAEGKITIPKYIWKIVLVLPKGDDELNRIHERTRVIAVLTENTNEFADKHWGNYRVSVDEIEVLTGYDFINAIPESIQEVIEAKVDNLPVIIQ